MIQSHLQRQALQQGRRGAPWLGGLLLAFAGQLIAWSFFMRTELGLFLLGSVVVGLAVGRVTPGPWIAGLVGVTLAAVATGMFATATESGPNPSLFAMVASGVFLIGLGLFTPAYLFGSAARPRATDWTYPPASVPQRGTGTWQRATGLSRGARVALGVLVLECDVVFVIGLLVFWVQSGGWGP